MPVTKPVTMRVVKDQTQCPMHESAPAGGDETLQPVVVPTVRSNHAIRLIMIGGVWPDPFCTQDTSVSKGKQAGLCSDVGNEDGEDSDVQQQVSLSWTRIEPCVNLRCSVIPRYFPKISSR